MKKETQEYLESRPKYRVKVLVGFLVLIVVITVAMTLKH
jgi:hypothetical protein